MRHVFAWVFGCLVASLAGGPAEAREEAPGKPTPYLQDRERGWFWYEDPPKPAEAKPLPKPPAGAPAASLAKPAEVRMYEQFKANMEEARIVAMFNPTQANVERYLQYRTALVKIADQLSEVGQRLVWANPAYDFTQERPINAIGLDVYKEEQARLKRDTLARLARTHVLYFFFRSDCPHCHAFAPMLSGFSRATGIKIFPVSMDGPGLPDFPRPYQDRGQAEAMGVSKVPALFLANPATRQITPVTFQSLTEMELIDRLVALENPGVSGYVDAATPERPLLIDTGALP
jgi:conjugal transfer pilus assembly protein TraF